MKKSFRAFMMCLTMFTAIPVPYRKWDEKARHLVSVFLPFIGAIIGAIWAALAYFLRISMLPSLVCGALLCAFPFVITGAIHMDGFLDVVDAKKSYRDIEEKKKILKDPHVGSFAVIEAIILVIMQFALFSSAKGTANYLTLILIPIVSRCASALCVTLLRPMSESEYAGLFGRKIKISHTVVLLSILDLSVAAGFVFLGKYGFASVAVLLGYLICLLSAYHSFKGVSGDVAGYCLVFGELCGIAVYSLI